MNSLFDDVPQMSNGVMDQVVRKKKPQLSIMSNLWDGLTDVIAPIVGNTPFGWAFDKASNVTGKQVGDTVREMGEGFFHDLPQGTIDLGVDVINATGGLLGKEDDVIDRDKAQIVPNLFSNEERTQLNMKMVEDHSVARLMGQLLGGYAGIRSIAKKGLMGEAVSVAGSSATVDPTEKNLSAFMKDTKFNNALFEVMASGVDEEAGAMERLVSRAKFMADDLALAFVPVGLVKGVLEIKNNPAIKKQLLDTLNPERLSILDNNLLIPNTKFNVVPDKKGLLHLVDEGVQVSSEAKPSMGLSSGRQLAKLPIEVQRLHQQETNTIMGSFIEDMFDVKIIDDVDSPAYFEGNTGVSRQTTYSVETEIINGVEVPTAQAREKVKQMAATIGHVQDQDAVTAHYLVPIRNTSEADLADIPIGRILKDDEMKGIVEILEREGIDPNHIAPVTTSNGVHLLNTSFGDLDNGSFVAVSDIIGEYLKGTDVKFYKNGFLDDGYIGGFDGYKSGQQAYDEIASQFGNTGRSKSDQSWGSHADAVEAKLQEVRANTENFLKTHTPKKTIRQIGEEVDALAQANKTVIRIGDYSEKANQAIYDRMLGEAQAILKGGDKEARGWYTTKFQTALDLLSKRHPELAQGADQSSRDLFSSLVAITSDGAKIKDNLKFANDVYQSYKQTGKVNLHVPAHTSSNSFRLNLNLLQNVIDEKGLRGALDWLSETQSSKAIKDQYKINTGYKVDVEVPNSTIFGAKLGMFHANLMGQPNWLTMDRWWSRTFNRYRGQMTIQPTDTAMKAYRKAAKIPASVPDSEVIEMAHVQARKYAKSGYKNKTIINKKANNVSKQIKGLRNDPQNASDRAFMMEVTDRVAKELQKEYPDMTTADLQAILWYGEKYRMKEFGSRSPVDVHDYSDVVGGLLKPTTPPPITGLLDNKPLPKLTGIL